MQIRRFNVVGLHSHMDQNTRMKNLELFSQKNAIVLFTTLTRGIRSKHVRIVVNWDLPMNTLTRTVDMMKYKSKKMRACQFGPKGVIVNFKCTEDQDIFAQLHPMIEIFIEQN